MGMGDHRFPQIFRSLTVPYIILSQQKYPNASPQNETKIIGTIWYNTKPGFCLGCIEFSRDGLPFLGWPMTLPMTWPIQKVSTPFVTMGHHGSPWVTVGSTVGHRASSCPAFCVLCQRKASSRCAKTAGPFVEVQGLGARCWLQIPHVSHVNNCKFGLRSTVLTGRLSIEPGTSTRHVPERKHPSTQLGPGRLQVIGIYSFSIRPSRIKNPLYPLFNS